MSSFTAICVADSEQLGVSDEVSPTVPHCHIQMIYFKMYLPVEEWVLLRPWWPDGFIKDYCSSKVDSYLKSERILSYRFNFSTGKICAKQGRKQTGFRPPHSVMECALIVERPLTIDTCFFSFFPGFLPITQDIRIF
ncbi:hypothetical protein CSKR_203197 [Clonorchis sinensis]|uniref:Uncharacterized protein n=1 Tax=Clonorchis sinensis TaxID=79923 RepID=A0A8T1M860_CLOSI|nr:hypothetical protein CSKR_203197 [Clonorchis sinensis]